MESVVPASSGFHRDLTHLIMIMERSLSISQFVKTISMYRFYDEALLGVPGSLANVKDKFFHRRAGKNVKVGFLFFLIPFVLLLIYFTRTFTRPMTW